MSRVVIAGGGIAGLEALIALRAHLGPAARIDLVEPAAELVERQRSVAEPFGGARPRRFDLAAIAADHGAVLVGDRLRAVDTAARVAHTVGGEHLHYDALLVAVGARADVAIGGALTFRGPRDVGPYRRLLHALGTGRVRRVAFAVPGGVAWTLPLYELALLTAAELHGPRRDDVALTVVTPESRPLDLFGSAAAARVAELLARRGIAVRTGATPARVEVGGLALAGGGFERAEWVVALPRLIGPWLAGLPHDGEGFIPTDEHGAVAGAEGVWAAGDGTAFAIKQGGLAAAQADAAAAAIAAALGAPVEPAPFRATLDAVLLDEPWSTAPKVFARRLGPYLAKAEHREAVAP